MECMEMKLRTSATLASISMMLLLVACAEKMMEPPPPPPPPPPQAMAAPPPPPPPSVAAPQASGIRPGSLEDFRVNVGDRVFYDYDRADLDDQTCAVPAGVVGLERNVAGRAEFTPVSRCNLFIARGIHGVELNQLA